MTGKTPVNCLFCGWLSISIAILIVEYPLIKVINLIKVIVASRQTSINHLLFFFGGNSKILSIGIV